MSKEAIINELIIAYAMELETIQNYIFIGEDPATSNAGWYYRTVARTADGWKIARTRVKMQKTRTR